MINLIPSVSNISYSSNSYQQSDFMHFFNQALEAGYTTEEAKKIARKKVKEKNSKKKDDNKRKVENTYQTNQITKGIDRRA